LAVEGVDEPVVVYVAGQHGLLLADAITLRMNAEPVSSGLWDPVAQFPAMLERQGSTIRLMTVYVVYR
jgi:hypothetical protein